MTTAPTNYPPVLSKALSALSEPRQRAFIDHLDGGTSANYLSEWLGRTGHPVSATTIKVARQAVSS